MIRPARRLTVRAIRRHAPTAANDTACVFCLGTGRRIADPRATCWSCHGWRVVTADQVERMRERFARA
jgi:hypothetical protein